MGKARTIGLSIIIILVILVILIGGGWYFYLQQNYVSTSDAFIRGNVVPITASGDGYLTNWSATVGQNVNSGVVMGKVDGFMGTTNIDSPISGTILQNNAVNHEVVVPGEPLAYLVNLNSLDVIAYLKETSINNVTVGKKVDITIDAYPNTSFSGYVTQIGSSSAVISSGVPNTSLSGTFEKTVQRVPVYISIDGSEGKALMPGMSVEVRIHRN